MSLLCYTPREVSVSLAGYHTITGFSDSALINIFQEEKGYESKVAMDGSIERKKSVNQNFKLEITLAQSSPSNDILNILYEADQMTGLGKFPVMINDGLGNTNFFGLACWVDERPNAEFANSMTERRWVLTCTGVKYRLGGNAPISGAVDAAAEFVSYFPAIQAAVGAVGRLL